MFYVYFGNNNTFHKWREGHKTYTGAWLSYFSARQEPQATRVPLAFPGYPE